MGPSLENTYSLYLKKFQQTFLFYTYPMGKKAPLILSLLHIHNLHELGPTFLPAHCSSNAARSDPPNCSSQPPEWSLYGWRFLEDEKRSRWETGDIYTCASHDISQFCRFFDGKFDIIQWLKFDHTKFITFILMILFGIWKFL